MIYGSMFSSFSMFGVSVGSLSILKERDLAPSIDFYPSILLFTHLNYKPEMSNQETARETAFDAIASKASAWKKGYFVDEHFHKVAKPHPVIKDPMINRGTWFRITLFQRTLQAFIDNTQEANVVILGCGLDTLYMRCKNYKNTHRFIELDLPEICQMKAQKLKMEKVPDKELTYKFPDDSVYQLQPADLETDFFDKLDIKHDIPTLFLSDVVVSYLESDNTVELIKNIGKYFPKHVLLLFEMINPHDAFGDVMIYNMSQREVYMPTFAEIGYIQNYRRQLRNIQCETFISNAWVVYNKWQGRKDIEGLELLDEFEQFQLIMEHYGVIFGSNDQSGTQVFELVFQPCGIVLDDPVIE